MSRSYNRRRTGWLKPWENVHDVNMVGMSQFNPLDLFKPKPPLPPLQPGQAPPGQTFINRLFGATPENPVKLPFESIETEVSLDPNTKTILLAGMGILAFGLIGSALIKR